VAYTNEEGRAQLLDDIAEAAGQLAVALASLTEAYEALDEGAASRLEDELFRPVQSAYGVITRAHTGFSSRHATPPRAFEPHSPGLHSADPRVYVQRAIEASERAEHGIAELQDSMLPVEVGDPELRAGLSTMRELIASVPARGRELLRTLGR
jgi:hypothetical protein